MFSTTTCALKVNTDCEGWSETISKILAEIKDLSYNFDIKKGKIYISGKVDSPKIMNLINKHGNTVKLCWMKSKKQYPPIHMPMHMPVYGAGYPPCQRGFYPPFPPTPMPFYHHPYQYNNYDSMYGHYQHGYHPHDYHPQLPYYY